ncbi:MAG: beta-phosphoglucomutase [Clostridiales bacterium]|nr:beta-phosphoglucomutase [Clostridiales bacterium]
MKYKAVIFDLDGVICHTDQYHFKAWRQIAQELGIAFDEEKNNRLRGVSRMQSLEIILEEYDGQLTDEKKLYYASKKNDAYVELLNDMTSKDIELDVKKTLNTLRQLGIKMAIGSSSRNAKRILSKIGYSDFFDAISDGTNITKTKPEPEVFLKASQYLSIDPKHCIVVEDAKAGVEAAIAGGMDCAAIGDAANYDMATFSINKLSDLLDILTD